LTILTQLGGLAWLAALPFRRRWLAFPLLYAALWAAAFVLAPYGGRVALPCTGQVLSMQSPFYCVLMRNYVSPPLSDATHAAATQVNAAFPGTTTLVLDAGFPFLDGMPLLPHLSHDDGDKVDFAFFYSDREGRYLPGKTRSAIGYWAFEIGNETTCPDVWLSLRWDLAWLQPVWPDRPIEPLRTAALISSLLADPGIGKVFVEPPLARRLGLSDPKLKFQGCRAARHDDHVHAQL
jgi:hypothetical protein